MLISKLSRSRLNSFLFGLFFRLSKKDLLTRLEKQLVQRILPLLIQLKLHTKTVVSRLLQSLPRQALFASQNGTSTIFLPVKVVDNSQFLK